MLTDYSFNKLELNSTPKPFICGSDEFSEDLNQFFREDAPEHLKELLAVTYYYESSNHTVAYFSVINDKIINKDEEEKTISNNLVRKIPNEKRRPNYPAAKVARLGVHVNYQSQNLGSEILTFVKRFFVDNNKTGCRFITVDARNETRVLNFYKNNGFKFLTEHDNEDDTRLMYFDLIALQPSF